jgi:hypothetical protein
MNKYLAIIVATVMLGLANEARADFLTSIGNTGSSLVNGSTASSVNVLAAQSGQLAPFNGSCGGDAGAAGSTNCSTIWSFSNAALGSGVTITGATLTLGIWDIDSKAAGNQVANFSITSGESLTSAFNAAAEALNSNTGSINSEYDIFTFTLSSASFSALAAGNTGLAISLQGPGLGVLGNTGSNGASLIFSTLDIQTTTTAVGGTVPEPSTWILLLTGIGSMMILKRRRTNE